MILDLIIVLLVIIIGFIGYKVGFLTTLIKLTSALSGIIIAICFTKPITNMVCDSGWDSGIENQVYVNVISSDVFQSYVEGGEGVEGINQLLQELGIPPFISSFIAGGIAESIDPNEIALKIADGVSYVLVFLITFVALLLFSSLFFLLLKLIVKGIRKSVGFIRVIDGILGIVFFLLIFYIILCIFFMIISLIMHSSDPSGGFVLFFKDQLHLEDGAFGIAKYIYENNFIGNFFGLIF